MNEEIIIIGNSFSGLGAAIAFAKYGHKIKVIAPNNKPQLFGGLQIAPNYQGHVDDHFWAEILPYLKLSIGTSVVAVNDVFDGNHPYQKEVLSDEKLNLLY